MVKSEIRRFIQISSAVFKLLIAIRQVSVLTLLAVALQHFVANALKEESDLVLLHTLCVFFFLIQIEQNEWHNIT